MTAQNKSPPALRNVIGEQLMHWQGLRAQLESMEDIDEQALLDTLEGETNLHEILLAISEEIAEREALSEVTDMRIKALQERKGRIDRSTETLRNMILQAMDSAGVQKIPGITATLSISEIKPQPIIEDESQIPAKYWVSQDPELDKKAIAADVKEGISIPGVTMSNGKISLTIRRK